MIFYENLEEHFKAPKKKPKSKRVPRKFKKKWKHVLQGKRYSFLSLDEKLWYIQYLTNNDYCRFLIKRISVKK